MSEEIKWLAGAILAVITALGGFLTRDRHILQKIEDGDKSVLARVDAITNDLNQVKKEYLRRDDLSAHVQSLERLITLSREDIKDLSARIDNIALSLAKSSKDGSK